MYIFYQFVINEVRSCCERIVRTYDSIRFQLASQIHMGPILTSLVRRPPKLDQPAHWRHTTGSVRGGNNNAICRIAVRYMLDRLSIIPDEILINTTCYFLFFRGFTWFGQRNVL